MCLLTIPITLKMFLEFLGCLFYIGLVILSELKRRKDIRGRHFSPSLSKLDSSTELEDEHDLLTDDMTDFEKAVAFVNSGRYHYTDAAVIVISSFVIWLETGSLWFVQASHQGR